MLMLLMGQPGLEQSSLWQLVTAGLLQARQDPGLVSSTAGLLLETLRSCPPLSLREPAECLAGLEDLLCCWLQERNVVAANNQ